MNRYGTPAFLAGLAVAAAFVVLSSRGLPTVVASHFAATGAANGFMSRNGYVVFMLAVTVGTPLLVAFLPRLLREISPRLLNLPHREHWLAPERREASYAYVDGHTLRFGWLLAAFLCYVHWLVVAANRAQPPQLSNMAFIAGLVVFMVCLVLWVIAMLGRFKRP